MGTLQFFSSINNAMFILVISVIWQIFLILFQAYMKKVLKYLEENDRAAEIEEFKTNINGVMKELMGSFKDLQFFSGKTQIIFFNTRNRTHYL